jgi:hypothetical protein
MEALVLLYQAMLSWRRSRRYAAPWRQPHHHIGGILRQTFLSRNLNPAAYMNRLPEY